MNFVNCLNNNKQFQQKKLVLLTTYFLANSTIRSVDVLYSSPKFVNIAECCLISVSTK